MSLNATICVVGYRAYYVLLRSVVMQICHFHFHFEMEVSGLTARQTILSEEFALMEHVIFHNSY